MIEATPTGPAPVRKELIPLDMCEFNDVVMLKSGNVALVVNGNRVAKGEAVVHDKALVTFSDDTFSYIANSSAQDAIRGTGKFCIIEILGPLAGVTYNPK